MRFGLLVALAVIAADQVSKALLIDLMLSRGDEPIVVTGFFRLVMVWNRGVSFGVLNEGDGALGQRWLLVGIAVNVVAALFVWLRRSRERWFQAVLGAIIGGAVGNVIDRVRFGAVADFFDAHLGDTHWPAFNLADAAISIGVVALVADGLLRRKSKAT